ncbi:hypothetical protein BU24DRAFT_442997 [Aaosphaeria arxii CBS 175.79]|uniref:Uncharacterized protein n=1 Tax=Aaosphaeria arxii CBS 175.79 TaxID=1450172 RepID=A0A6A5XIH0_9PLEO|nr:uncharacterized protein BU24DRAFT_442997 [Aaosphaeria arxii CBS 175.79]KAF2012580.1 hypothetical protein BU24DRAFT_442997 [Aaosphaeria arxii CBS 175.79]
MSGIEVAGLAIGIVPIVVEIIKSFQTTKDRLKTFTHHAQVVYDVQLRFRVAATNFANDCQLLLKAVVEDASELSEMIVNPKHQGWKAPSLEDNFRRFLERDYELCEAVVVRVRDVLRETQSQLAELSRSDTETSRLRNLQQAFNITLKENQYRKWLDELDQWNVKLGNLRAQRCKLKKRRPHRLDATVRRSVPRHYTDIHTASQGLYETLQKSWSCTNASHVDHQAKLSLDAQADYGTARLDVVIACRRRDSVQGRKGSAEPPIWLHVQSVTSSATTTGPVEKLPAIAGVLSESLRVEQHSLDPAPPKAPTKLRKKALKRVHFDEPSASTSTEDSASTANLAKAAFRSSVGPMMSLNSQALSFAMQNLRATQSFCCHLSNACLSTSHHDPCLGYLETQEALNTSKFIFYDAVRHSETEAAKRISRKDSNPITSILEKLQVLHQLTMAHKLAVATLQYHSTSWLAPDWDLHDVSCFDDPSHTTDDDIARSLQTLHLSTQFPPSRSTPLGRKRHDHNQLRYLYGIRNLTLAKLGVALLEIGRKKDITSLSTDEMPHCVISARKLLAEDPSSLASLGKRYIKMARQCIDCDFSCGDDLTEEELRSAVYTDVVCVLADMIGDWKQFLGIK